MDLADFPHIDFNQNIGDLSNFATESVDLIYSSHAFEYFDRAEGEKVLGEWFRVLKHKGIIRLAVPDFEALVQVYTRYGDLNLIHGPLYGRWEIKTSEGTITGYHKTCYDFSSLKELLNHVGFVSVRRYDWRETEHKDFDDYSQAYIPHMDKENGLLISLNVEAVKP